MTRHNKVMWTEGMFLQPQHFQQQERFLSRQLDARLATAGPHPEGFATLQIDQPALLQGQLALTAATGVMRDGLAFAMPDDEPAPPALEIPADTRDELVLLAIARADPGVVESDVEGEQAGMPPRYHALELSVADGHARKLSEAPIQIGRLNLRLVLESRAGNGFVGLGVARIVERRADGRVVLDPRYIPPTLQVSEQITLEGWLREVLGMLHQRGEALAARLAQPGRAGVGEIADFLLLQTVNRHEPLFDHARQLRPLHPERLYAMCLALAGELACFRDKRRPPSFPVYAHHDLAGCFEPVLADIRQSLSMVMEQSAIPIELQDRKYGVRVAVIADAELRRSASFVLAVNAQMPGDAVRARFPTQVKIGPAEKIRDLVNLQLPGVTLRPMPVAPRQIPYHAGFNYFELETRGNEMWKQLETSGGLAMHIAGEFPGLELELWAIR
jgi:type VI secretion system protein ImpJ